MVAFDRNIVSIYLLTCWIVVSQLLKEIGLSEYAEKFKELGFDDDVSFLHDFIMEDPVESLTTLGVTKLGHRFRLLRALDIPIEPAKHFQAGNV